MRMTVIRSLTIASITALALAACAGGGQSNSLPHWKVYGFDRAGAQ